MKTRIIVLLSIFIVGCGTSSKVNTEYDICDNNKDVFILSNLISDYFRKTDKLEITLDEILQADTLRRISNNFKEIKINLGANIEVYYKLSGNRDIKKIELSEIEHESIKTIKWNVKHSKNQYDGEIQFEYGERFYGIRKIIINQ